MWDEEGDDEEAHESGIVVSFPLFLLEELHLID